MKKCIKNIQLIFLLLLLVFPALSLAANSLHPTLTLTSIKQLSAQESHDEIYLLISDLGVKSKSFYTIPGNNPYFIKTKSPMPLGTELMHPHSFWKEAQLSSLHDVQLWSRPLVKNDGAQLIVSLVESDMPPFNLDDTMGSVKLNLVNRNNKLKLQLLPFGNAEIIKQRRNGADTEYSVQIKNKRAKYLLHLKLVVK